MTAGTSRHLVVFLLWGALPLGLGPFYRFDSRRRLLHRFSSHLLFSGFAPIICRLAIIMHTLLWTSVFARVELATARPPHDSLANLCTIILLSHFCVGQVVFSTGYREIPPGGYREVPPGGS